MKKIVFLALLAVVSCSISKEDFIKNRAIGYVKQVYKDYDKLIMYKVDTVTYGDNLDYRIEQADMSIKLAEGLLSVQESGARELARYGGDPDMERIEETRQDVKREKDRAAALDSVKKALSPDVLNTPTAFTCCIAYNYPNNLVWVQVDTYGNLYVVDKNIEKLLLNPGDDAPGYLEVNNRFRKKSDK